MWHMVPFILFFVVKSFLFLEWLKNSRESGLWRKSANIGGTMAGQIKTVRTRGRAGELWLGRLGIQAKHRAPLVLGLGCRIIGSVDWHMVGALLLGSVPGSTLAATSRSTLPIASCSEP